MPTEDKASFFENMKTEMPGMVKARIKFLSNKDELYIPLNKDSYRFGGPIRQNLLIEDLLIKGVYTGQNEEIEKLFNMLTPQDRNSLGNEMQNDMARITNQKLQHENYTIAETKRQETEILTEGAILLERAITLANDDELINIRKDLLKKLPLQSDKINKLIDSLFSSNEIIESSSSAITELENGYLYFTLTKEDVIARTDITPEDKIAYYKKFASQESNDHWENKPLYKDAKRSVQFIPSKDTGVDAKLTAFMGGTVKEREGAILRGNLLKQTTALLVDGEANIPYGRKFTNPQDIAAVILELKAESETFKKPEDLVKYRHNDLMKRQTELQKIDAAANTTLNQEQMDEKDALEKRILELKREARILMARGMIDGNGNLVTPQSIINKLKEHPRFGQKYTNLIDGPSDGN